MFFRKRKYKSHRIMQVGLSAGGMTRWMRALYDTGNCLYDRPGKKPVSIISERVLEECFPAAGRERQRYLSGRYADPKLRFHYLSYSSLGCPDGLILVFTADYLLFGKNGRKGMYMHPRIAVTSDGSLFGPDCQIILNPDVLQEQEE